MSEPRIRLAAPADAAGLARVETDTWRDAYPTLLPEKFLVGGQGTAAHWRRRLAGRGRDVLVAETAGRVTAYATWGAAAWTPPGAVGRSAAQLYELYVHMDQRGLGLGRRLCAEVARRLVRGPTRHLYVEVLDGNPARFFYENLGAGLVARTTHDFAGQSLPSLVYRWDDLAALAAQQEA